MIPSGVKVFLASHPIDFRKGPDSLLSLVRDASFSAFTLSGFRGAPYLGVHGTGSRPGNII
jgi:hypothetical protein